MVRYAHRHTPRTGRHPVCSGPQVRTKNDCMSARSVPSAPGSFVEGWITLVRTVEGDRFVWWGRDGSGNDLIATINGAVFWTESPEELDRVVRTEGWGLPGSFAVDTGATLDIRAAQAWVRSRQRFDAESALNLWNLAEDVLRSTTGDRLTSGRNAATRHGNLTAMALPWLLKSPRTPTWSSYELGTVRGIVQRADRIVHCALNTR